LILSPVPDQCGGGIGPEPRHITAGSPGAASMPAFLGERGPVRLGELLAHVVDEMVTDYEFSRFG
jgi:hypothetical protein